MFLQDRENIVRELKRLQEENDNLGRRLGSNYIASHAFTEQKFYGEKKLENNMYLNMPFQLFLSELWLYRI